MEKVTLDDVIEETLLICDVSGVGQVKSMDPDLRKLYSVFLKQIRNELYEKAAPIEDSDGYIYSKTLFMSDVDEIFNKYLNQN